MRLLVAILLLALATPLRAAPNILFVLIDDMGYADLSCFGGTRAKTPHIDRLASEGIRFTQFYVNAPICSPSRVAFLTGQYPARWRITSFLASRKEDADRGIADWLDPAAPTVARFLQQSGYYTAHVGKWHMGGQRDVADAPAITRYGFDASLTNFEGLGERILPKFDFAHGPTDTSAKFGGEGARWVDRKNVTAAFVDRALIEIDHAGKAGKPFYINVWPDDVHTPVVPDYVTVLETMDRELGRLFDAIRAKPELRDNTIILLCSDNGPEPKMGVTGGLRGAKGQLFEGGIRSPLIAWSPKLVAGAGKTNDTTVLAAMDVAPSLLAIANVKADAKFDGANQSDALIGRSEPKRETPILWVRPPDRPGPTNSFPDLAIREGEWKLLVERDGSQPELFNIPADPNETKNLAAEHPELVTKLSKQVIEWEKSIP